MDLKKEIKKHFKITKQKNEKTLKYGEKIYYLSHNEILFHIKSIMFLGDVNLSLNIRSGYFLEYFERGKHAIISDTHPSKSEGHEVHTNFVSNKKEEIVLIKKFLTFLFKKGYFDFDYFFNLSKKEFMNGIKSFAEEYPEFFI